MTPTALDLEAFKAHVAARPHRFGCMQCPSTRLQLNRISMVPDAGAAAHIGETRPALEEQATPVALIMCLDCFGVQAFAWLPIVAAYQRGSAAMPVLIGIDELAPEAVPPAATAPDA